MRFMKVSFLHVYSNLYVYYFLQNFPSYMFIPTYTYIWDSRVMFHCDIVGAVWLRDFVGCGAEIARRILLIVII